MVRFECIYIYILLNTSNSITLFDIDIIVLLTCIKHLYYFVFQFGYYSLFQAYYAHWTGGKWYNKYTTKACE